jgi:hypothetical protein
MSNQQNTAWFEEGRWPIAKNDEISHHHFEDLRKRIFVLRNPSCGNNNFDYIKNTWTHGTSFTKEIFRGDLNCIWFGEYWVNCAEWPLGGGAYPDPPYEYMRPIRVTVGSTVYKSLKVHTSGTNFSTDLAAGKWAVDTSIPFLLGNGNVPTTTPYYTPNAWQPNTQYWINEWIDSNYYWFHTVDPDKYHDCDSHQTRRYYGTAYRGDGTGDGTEIYEKWWCTAADLYPIQTEEIEHHPPVFYSDTSKYRYTYKDKIGFSAHHITIPHQAGAQWRNDNYYYYPPSGRDWVRASPFQPLKAIGGLGDQYSNTINLPPSAGYDGELWDQNPKVNGSYQCAIEYISSASNLRMPADSTYITNWQADTGRNWNDDTQSDINKYPDIADLYWGCNASGFEYIKKITNMYDWYWDDEFPFYTSNHAILLGQGKTQAQYPLPVGTWRRWWKNSMGRPHYKNPDGSDSGIPKFMRSAEMGDPVQGSYTGLASGTVTGPLGDQRTYHVFYPAGTFTTVVPTLDQFMTASYTVLGSLTHWNGSAYENEKDIFKVSGNHVSDFKAGSVIYFGTGTALAGYKSNYAYVLKSAFDGTNTVVQVNIDIRGFISQLVKGNSNIATRHDPAQVECDSNGTLHFSYELTADLVNEMHDAIYNWTYIPISPCLQTAYANAYVEGGPAHNPGEVAAAWADIYSRIKSSPDDWNPNNDLSGQNGTQVVYLTPNYSSNPPDPSTMVGEVLYNSNNPYGAYSDCEVDYEGYTDGMGGWYWSAQPQAFAIDFAMCQCTAIKWVGSTGGKTNASSVQLQITYTTGNAPNQVRHYAYVSLPTNGSWLVFRFPPVGLSVISSSYDQWGAGYLYAGANGYMNFGFDATTFTVAIDYDNVPAMVFDRIGKLARDNWGYIIRDISPALSDTRPPLPEPPVWTTRPYGEFQYIENDGTTSSFTVNQTTGVLTHTLNLAEGDLVQFVTGGSLPVPLIADHVYKAKNVVANTCQIFDRKNGQDIQIHFTSAGSGLNTIEKSTCFALHVKSDICKCEDLDGSTPVYYREVAEAGVINGLTFADIGGGTDIWNQDKYSIDFIDRYISMKEASVGGIGISGTNTVTDDGDGTWSAVLTVVDNPLTYLPVGATVHISASDVFTDSYTVTARTATTVTLDIGERPYLIDFFTPTKNRIYNGTDNGYGLVQWQAEDAYNYQFKPQTKDSAAPANLTSLAFAEQDGITTPGQYPMALLS